MPITRGTGNLLTAQVDALVNTVNTQGVMGKGIALQFKKAWPAMFRDYQAASKRGDIVPGRVHVWETGLLSGPRFVINFPTKRHWREPSRLPDIEAGLADLADVIRARGITSIAIPPLGCGNGGLAWRDVEPVIHRALEPLAASVDIRVFPPSGAPAAEGQPVAERRPTLTPARAALLAIMREYERLTFEPPTLIAAQKLAYFLQATGQPLRLEFVRGQYGPYADNLRKTLRAMEGHFIVGFGDGSAPVTAADPIRVRPDVEDELNAFVAGDPATQDHIDAVMRSIEGFESSYGLELLASVHWVMAHDPEARAEPTRAYEDVREWNRRKATLFTPTHVRAAWLALQDRELVHASEG